MTQPSGPAGFELRFEDQPRDGGNAAEWARVFGAERPLRVEIGVGVSTFLIQLALADPDYNYVGFEYSAERVATFLRKLDLSGVQNIRVIRADVTRWIAELFASGTIQWLYINHPDPWPKRRHRKKRFVNPENARTLSRLLGPGGKLSLRTDFAAYAEQMLSVLNATPGLRNLTADGAFAPFPVTRIVTYYEDRFLQAGQPIYYLEYEKLPGDGKRQSV